MRNTTKTFAVAIVVSTLLTGPVFAAQQQKAKSTRTQDEQPTIVRVIKSLKRLFDLPTITNPSDLPTITNPSDLPTITNPH